MKKTTRALLRSFLFPRSKTKVSLEIDWSQWKKDRADRGDKSIELKYLPAKFSSKGCIILAHPYLSIASCFFIERGHVEMYQTLGYDIVLFDFNGFGESPFIDFEYAEDLDIVIKKVQELFKGKPIFVHGISFGASHTITTHSKYAHPIQKIIIENCLDTNISYYKIRKYRKYIVLRILDFIFPKLNRDNNYVKGISKLQNVKNVLLIYNVNDELTTIEMGEMLRTACNTKVDFCVLEGKHLESISQDHEKYKTTIESFLSDGMPQKKEKPSL